jgi:transcriptional regulator with XRE-family HTH domain
MLFKSYVVSFWRRVNGLIKTQNTKQEAVAQQCNISYQTFRGWVTRKCFPDGYETYLIAQALGTTVEFLFTGRKPEPPATSEALSEIQAVIDKYQKPPKKKK